MSRATISNVKLPSGMLTTVGSGSSGPAIGILPWAIGDGTVTGSGTDLVTYDPTNGVRLLTGRNTTRPTALAATANNYQLSAPATISATTTVNAIKFAAGGTGLTVNQPLTVTSGANPKRVRRLGEYWWLFHASIRWSGRIIHAVGNVDDGAAITGTNGLTKGSGGDLILTNHTNDFGTLTINGGNVVVDNESELGQSSAGIVINGGYFKPTAGVSSLSSNHSITMASTGGFDVGTSQSLAINSGLTGAGTLDKRGGHTRSNADNSNFQGALSLMRGTVEINADNNLGSGSPNDVDAIAANSINIRFEGGALRVASGSFDMNAQRAVVLDQTGTFDVATGASVNLNGYMYGPRRLNQNRWWHVADVGGSRQPGQIHWPCHGIGRNAGLSRSLAQNNSPSVVVPNYWTLDNNAVLSMGVDGSQNFNTTASSRDYPFSGGGQILSDNGADYALVDNYRSGTSPRPAVARSCSAQPTLTLAARSAGWLSIHRRATTAWERRALPSHWMVERWLSRPLRV